MNLPQGSGIAAGSNRKDGDREPGEQGGPTAPFATECDLVMKGGITSGVVYPLAISEISKAFRLRSIGGTSAGAIAAAAAAAAELGRQRHRAGQLSEDPRGFEQLAGLPQHLARRAEDGKGTKLLAFFQPKAALRPVFDILLAAIGHKQAGARIGAVLAALLRRHWLAAALGFALGALPLWLDSGVSCLGVVWLAGLAVLAAIAFAAWRVVRAVLHELPGHGFGVCSGMPAEGSRHPEEALTVWLADYFDALAGQKPAHGGPRRPMTFGDLREHGIDLQMVTTCLTLGRPFRLPFRDDEQVRENKLFLYRKSEFLQLFPRYVVDWMEQRERPYKISNDKPFKDMDFDGFLNLPLPDDLPVVVAVRMSLSFPLLLSAIPLYAIDFRKQRVAGETPERCWFTDGGVGSNFPIHFFDAPLPTRPTFGLDLGLAETPDEPRVVFPRDNGDARLAYWRRFGQGGGLGAIAGFLGAVVNVAKDWNHETLSHLPGFRDRIGLVKLSAEEGGLNLAMPEELIGQLTEYGRQAGIEFVVRFGDPARWPAGAQPSRMNWENHQLIRLRLLLASVAEMLEGLQAAHAQAAGTPQDYGRFFTTAAGPDSYRFRGIGRLACDPLSGLPTTQCGLACKTLEELLEMARCMAATAQSAPDGQKVLPSHGAPKPTPELKLRPRI